MQSVRLSEQSGLKSGLWPDQAENPAVSAAPQQEEARLLRIAHDLPKEIAETLLVGPAFPHGKYLPAAGS